MGRGGLTPIRRVMNRGKKISTKGVLSFFITTPVKEGGGGYKVASIASKKKVDKRAVKRNRVRRRCRQCAEKLLLESPIPRNVNLEWIIMGNRSILTCSWEDLCTELVTHRSRMFPDEK